MKRLALSLSALLLLAPFAHAILDTNNNGMSDLWEKKYNGGTLFPVGFPALGDLDGDGFNNEREAAADTDPQKGNPPIGFPVTEVSYIAAVYASPDEPGGTPILISPECHVVEFSTIAGKQYRLSASPDLSNGSWQDVGTPIIGDGSIVRVGCAPMIAGLPADRYFWRHHITDIDSDVDGLTNAEEYQLGTNPNNSDSDNDGLTDKAEILAGLYPNNPDSDLDGILDGADATPLVNNAIADPDGTNLDSTLESNLIGRWDFETSVANSNETLLSSSTPTVVGAFDINGTNAVWDGRQGGIHQFTGMPSAAVQLTQSLAYGKLPTSRFQNKNTQTWSMWIKFPVGALDTSNGTRTLLSIGKYIGATDALGLPFLHAYFNGVNDTFNLDTYWISGNNFNRTGLASWPTPTNLDDGNFHHIAITFSPNSNAGRYEFYFDGALVSTLTGNKLPDLDFSQSGSAPYVFIGRKRTSTITANEETLGATLDRLRIYQIRLDGTSIGALYKQDIDRDGLWDTTECKTRYSDYQSSVNYHPDPADPNEPQPLQTGYARSPFLFGNSTLDFDQDELNDLAEQTLGTNLTKPDTDDDNLLDGFEDANSFNPLTAYSLGPNGPRDDLSDPDSDTLNTLTEYLNGSNPRNTNTDGDSKGDAAEIAQGSDPANAADSGAAPTDTPVQIPFHIFGDYTAWEATIKGKGPNDKRTRRFQMSAHNVAANQTMNLLKGNAYELSLRYIRTKPGESVPWYCWETTIDSKTTSTFTVADHWIVDNSSALLAQHTHSHGTNQVADKKVDIVPLVLEWKAVDGFANVEDHIDQWANTAISGKRIFPDYQDPNSSTLRHKLELIVKSSPAFAGKTVYVKAFDVDDSTPESFDTSDTGAHVIDPNREAGNDNLTDYLGTSQNGMFWTGFSWGGNTANGTLGANGEKKFIFRVGMQPGNNYRVVASLNDETSYSGVQVIYATAPKYLGPETSQTGGVFASPLLTVWRKLWVENDSMAAIPTDTYGYKRNDLSSDVMFPVVGQATYNSSTNETTFPINTISDVSSFTNLENGRFIVQSISHPVLRTQLVGTFYYVIVSGNYSSVPLGSEFRLYDDDDYGLDAPPLPRLDLVNDFMKSLFKPAFVDVIDSGAFNLRKIVPFLRNDDLGSSTIINTMKDLSEKNALWVCPVTAAYQFGVSEDGDPNNELPTYGGTRSYGSNQNSTVFIEACREDYDHSFRLVDGGSNPQIGVTARENLKNYITATLAHEMGHQPGNQTQNEDHAEGKLMQQGGALPLSPLNEFFSPKTTLRFRKSQNWSK